MADLKEKIMAEARRIEEDTEHSAKGHYNAADRWAKYHLYIGLPAAIIAAFAGGSAFNDMPNLAGFLAILSTALTTVLTFLKPSERAESHKAVAGSYLSLRNKTRIFREVELMDSEDGQAIKSSLMALSEERDGLNLSSPGIARGDYEKAKQDIDEGRTTHQVDKEG